MVGHPSPRSREQLPSCFHFSSHFRKAFVGLSHLARRCWHFHRFQFEVHFSWLLLFLVAGLLGHRYFQGLWARPSQSPSWTAREALSLLTHWKDYLSYHFEDFRFLFRNLGRWTHSWRNRHSIHLFSLGCLLVCPKLDHLWRWKSRLPWDYHSIFVEQEELCRFSCFRRTFSFHLCLRGWGQYHPSHPSKSLSYLFLLSNRLGRWTSFALIWYHLITLLPFLEGLQIWLLEV